jgi:glycosyltransferase involved in cell wall biosynthesis
MDDSYATTLLIYWGRRGGGAALFEQFGNLCRDENMVVLKSGRPTIHTSGGLQRPISNLNLIKWFSARRKLLIYSKENSVSNAVFVMASPWDIFLGRKLAKTGINVSRVIHDASPHPGELFPPKIWIRLLLNDSTRILTFSHYVANRLQELYGQNPTLIDVIPFPRIQTQHLDRTKRGSCRKVLLIGRGKKYQGQELLEEAWKMLNLQDSKLSICGQGFEAKNSQKGINYKSYWLTDQDLVNEIGNNDLVVFPYLEASQSGTIPICNALKVPVVITPVGGLIEQVDHMKNGIVASDVSARSIADAIKLALEFDWDRYYVPSDYSEKDLIRIVFRLPSN